MKLFTRYNRIIMLMAVLIFLISGIAYYFLLDYILLQEIDEVLSHKKTRMETFVRITGSLPVPDRLGEVQVSYTPVPTAIKELHSFATLYDSIENRAAQFRKFVFTLPVKNELYQVTLTRPLAGTHNLLTTLIFVTLATILTILLISVLINRIILRKLWEPFYATIAAMRSYKLGKVKEVQLPETNINEFQFLNENLEDTIHKAEEEYQSLKEFTENASHELQTPLAVIRSKLDLLIQKEDLSEMQSEELREIYGSVKKMSQLSRSLLLMTKIGNQQFNKVSQIDLKEKIEEKLKQFQELWNNSQLQVRCELEETLIPANENLVDILLNNLLSNASRHNIKGGSIDIHLQERQLSVSNTGFLKPLDPKRIFRRFYKEEAHSHHNGLGLSIVKQICEQSNIQIAYLYENGRHIFQLKWQESNGVD
ncbi:MAG: integral rane sensor signal transduction histidine kinase [Ferruginibacter sp.]|nr:integral rane sensor signal transduction histidine kinase [Ferruginibacter sp.]